MLLNSPLRGVPLLPHEPPGLHFLQGKLGFTEPASSPSVHRFSLWLLKQAQKCWIPLTDAPPSELCDGQELEGTQGTFLRTISLRAVLSAVILGWKSQALQLASPGVAVSPWTDVVFRGRLALVTSGTERRFKWQEEDALLFPHLWEID